MVPTPASLPPLLVPLLPPELLVLPPLLVLPLELLVLPPLELSPLDELPPLLVLPPLLPLVLLFAPLDDAVSF